MLPPSRLTLRLSPQSNFSYLLEMKWTGKGFTTHFTCMRFLSTMCYQVSLKPWQRHGSFPALLTSVRVLTILCCFMSGEAQGRCSFVSLTFDYRAALLSWHSFGLVCEQAELWRANMEMKGKLYFSTTQVSDGYTRRHIQFRIFRVWLSISPHWSHSSMFIISLPLAFRFPMRFLYISLMFWLFHVSFSGENSHDQVTVHQRWAACDLGSTRGSQWWRHQTNLFRFWTFLDFNVSLTSFQHVFQLSVWTLTTGFLWLPCWSHDLFPD